MKIICSFLFILFTLSYAYGQTAIIPSTEKVKIGGEVFYAHTVKKGETLYSLSKAYHVTIDQITSRNRAAAAGIKEGNILYIPAQPGENDVPEKQPVTSPEVKKQPDHTDTPSPSPQRNPGKKYKRHTVKWYEDITDISEKYNIPVEAILAFNHLSTARISTRQVLLIPDQEYMNTWKKEPEKTAAVPAQATPLREEETQTVPGENAAVSPQAKLFPANNEEAFPTGSAHLRHRGEPIKIAYILPLNSVYPDNVSSNFMDFYAGALLAVNDSKEEDGTLEINLYDQNEYKSVRAILNTPGFSGNQMIIGPIRQNALQEVIGYSNNTRIPLISPMDQNADPLLSECRYLIQVPTTTAKQIDNIVDLLAGYQKEHHSNVVLISEKGGADTAYIHKAEQLLKEKGIHYSTVSYGILDGRTIQATIASAIDSTASNIAFVPSNSEAFVSDVVRNLDLCPASSRITLFGLPKWRNFETIDVEHFHKMNLHLSLPYFVDYSNPGVHRFVLQYRALYHTDPSPYAFQGYDITKYFISRMQQYGNSFIHLDRLKNEALLQSDFHFSRTEENTGFENNATRNIRYNRDYSISVIE